MKCEKQPQYLIKQNENDNDRKQDRACHVPVTVIGKCEKNDDFEATLFTEYQGFRNILELSHATIRRSVMISALMYCLLECGICSVA